MSETATARDLDIDQLAKICGQFGSDNENVRRNAAAKAIANLVAARLDWSAVLGRRADGVADTLRQMELESSDAAAVALAAHEQVRGSVGNWADALRLPESDDHGSREALEAMLAAMRQAFAKAGLGDVWGYARDRRATEPQREPRPAPKQRTVRRNIPVVVVGKVELVSQYVDAGGRIAFEFTVRDIEADIEYGPIVTRDDKLRMKLIDGIGSVMRVTTRASSRPHGKQEAVRAIAG